MLQRKLIGLAVVLGVGAPLPAAAEAILVTQYKADPNSPAERA